MIIGIIFLSLITACRHKPSEEEQILQLIESVRQAAMEKDLSAILEVVSEDFQDRKERGKREIQGVLSFIFYRYRSINISIRRSEVTVEGENGQAVVDVLFSRSATMDPVSGSLPSDVALYKFVISLKKAAGVWKVIEGSWEKWGHDPEVD